MNVYTYIYACVCMFIYLYNLIISLRTYSDNRSIIYTIKTSYTLRITALLSRQALWKDIKSSESRKSHTHSTKLSHRSHVQ